METVQQDAFAMKELLDEDGDGLTGLAGRCSRRESTR